MKKTIKKFKLSPEAQRIKVAIAEHFGLDGMMPVRRKGGVYVAGHHEIEDDSVGVTDAAALKKLALALLEKEESNVLRIEVEVRNCETRQRLEMDHQRERQAKLDAAVAKFQAKCAAIGEACKGV